MNATVVNIAVINMYLYLAQGMVAPAAAYHETAMHCRTYYLQPHMAKYTTQPAARSY